MTVLMLLGKGGCCHQQDCDNKPFQYNSSVQIMTVLVHLY